MTNSKNVFGLDTDELIKLMHDDISDPTGLRRYLESKEAESERRYAETLRLNYYILAMSAASVLIGIASIGISLSK